MAYKSREEIVGKRFLSVRNLLKPKVSKISEWEWKSGIVRAVSNRDQTSVDFTVLVELDSVDWKKREWVRVHDVFQLFLVEHTLVWTRRPASDGEPPPRPFPALCYKPLVDKCGLAASKKRVVEFLVERDLSFVDDDDLKFYQEGDEHRYDSICDKEELQKEIRAWVDYQDGQKILLTTPVVLLGSRLEVYRAEGTTQWYTAFIHSVNDITKTLVVTDDTVLESHNEDPALVQMRIIDSGVVHSILRGDATPRRTSRQHINKDQQPQVAGRRKSQQQCASSGQQAKQVTFEATAHGSTTLNSPQSLLVATSTSTPKKPVREKTKKSQEKRKRKPADPSFKQGEEESRSISPSKRSKRVGETVDRQRRVASCLDKDRKDLASPLSCLSGSQTRDESGSKDKTKKKHLRPKKGSIPNASSTALRPNHKPKPAVSLCKSIGSGETNENKNSACENKLTLQIVEERGEDRKRNSLQGTGLPLTGSDSSITVSSCNTLVTTPVTVSLTPLALPKNKQKSAKGKKNSKVKNCEEGKGLQKRTKRKTPVKSDKVESGELGPRENLVEHGVACNNKREVAESVTRRDVGPLQLAVNSSVSGARTQHSVSESGGDNKEELHPGTPKDSEDTMHYKKQLLLAGGNSSPSSNSTHSNTPTSSLSSSIDVNRSVTDQLTKLAKTEKIDFGGGDDKSDRGETVISGTFAHSLTPPSVYHLERDLKTQELLSDRHRESSAFTCVRSNASQSNTSSTSSEERAESRASDSQVSSQLGDDRRPGSRLDDLRSVKSSPTSSPLVLDRSEPVNIYRDPELMSKNPVRSTLSVNSMHKTMSGPPYTNVPGTVPGGLTTTATTLPSHPSSLSRSMLPGLPYSPHQLPPGGVPPHALPLQHHHLAQLDALAAAAQQHQMALQHQYAQNAAQLIHSMPYGSISGRHGVNQLETLWHQKFPHTQLPPPSWLLAKQQEGLLGEPLATREHIERLEQERLERERMEKRLEMERAEQERAATERMERERREKREKMERERLEREKAEKEKVERERAERERLDRLEREKERKEREQREREWELQQKQQRFQERERILRESSETSAQAAVEEHFVESFRVAKLRGVQGLAPAWAPSITKGTGKGLVKMEAEKVAEEERIKREIDQSAICDDKRYMTSVHEQRVDMKPDVGKDGKTVYGYPPYHYSSSGYPHPSSNAAPSSALKPETIFSLYGYHPSQQHSTITTEQLQKKGLVPGSRPVKEEKGIYPASNPSPPRQIASPAHLPKDLKASSVIVENSKVKHEKQPVAAHSHHAPSLSVPSSSPRPQPRPAHTPEQRADHPMSSSSGLPNSGMSSHLMAPNVPGSNSYVPQTNHPTAFRALDQKSLSRSQSPYNKLNVSQGIPLASHAPQSGNLSQPQPINFSSKAAGQSSAAGPFPPVTAVTQPPVSLPSTCVSYTYSLIQQGLVPNPMYSQGTMPTTMHMARSQLGQQPVTSAIPVQNSNSVVAGLISSPSSTGKLAQHSPPSGAKRKSGNTGKDCGSLQSKRSKAASSLASSVVPDTRSGSASVPVSATSQTVSSLNVYPAANNAAMVGSRTTNTMLSTGATPPITGFMDSFKSFVENTVQNAFLQDEKTSREKEERERFQKQMLQQQQVGVERIETAVPGIVSRDDVIASPVSSASSQVGTVPHSSSLASIIDTINRVANGQDTDSDTLSAPSPPPQARCDNGASPHGGAPSAPKLKKAWLQRHADDKKPSCSPLVPSPLVLAQEDSNSSTSTTKEVKNFLKGSTGLEITNVILNGDMGMFTSSSVSEIVNNTSASNTGLTNGNITPDLRNATANDESTSSASETESQTPTNAKKRSKQKKPNTGSKKAKTDEKELSPTSAENSANTSRSKKSSNKRVKNEKEGTKQKEKNSARDTGSSPVPSSKSPALQQSTSLSSVPSPAASVPTNNSRKEDKSKYAAKQPRDTSCAPLLPANPEREKSASPQDNSSANGKDKKKTRRNKENPKEAKDKEASTKGGDGSFNKPLVKVTTATLKRTGAPFIQDGPCSELTPKLSKCRECKMTPNQRSKKIPNIFCRFYAFRRLKYNNKGVVSISGFSELSDADLDDIEPWLPRFPTQEPTLDEEMAKFILSKVGDKFCELVEQEKEAKSLTGVDPPIAWKRAVTGVREMCDVCDTTLFNMHWVCHKCGFVVCLDCYKSKIKAADSDDEDDCKWLTCSSNRQAHDARKLMLTQIIPSDALWELGRLIHDIRSKWSISAKCPCGQSSIDVKPTPSGKNGVNQLVKKMMNGMGEDSVGGKKSKKAIAAAAMQAEEEKVDGEESSLALLANVALGGGDKASKRLAKLVAEDEMADDGDKKSSCSTLRELLTKTAGKGKVPGGEKKSKPKSSGNTLDDIIQSVVEKTCPGQTFKFMHYIPRLGQWNRELPIIAHSLTETSVLYPDVPHSWLCDGRLLRLHDPRHKGNLKIFQEQWKRGQPVLVSQVHKQLKSEIWKPETFLKEFGEQENDLVNCRSGDVLMGNTMGDFWEGFESIQNRLWDKERDEPMLLKLKDWPPGDDFSELLPSRYQDLMQALPLPEYTCRNGKLNLASRLPDFLVRPDLGPKMYNAYGSAKFPKEGTTNLHLDISDAVNVMVYVGVPNDNNDQKEHEEAAVRAIDDAGCDSITKRRVREVHELPGALWQIYDAHDADKIRDFLNKVAKERGEIIEPDHDSIHDQSWYLDEELRDRLLKEYGVHGYTIVQCYGDAIFIPAGAPHQVRNLHSCIKVAEDFVSPEHLNHCFRLTQEFRQLSDTHSNHEDKLQVKNIIYHAVKDSIAVLRHLDHDK